MIRNMTFLLIFLLSVTLLTDSHAALVGEDPYKASGADFPDESNFDVMPYAIPCTETKGGIATVRCVWHPQARHMSRYDKLKQKQVDFSNHFEGTCIMGSCNLDGHYYGSWTKSGKFVVSLGYYLGRSTDNRPVAYRMDVGPLNGAEGVSYTEAGLLVWAFYKQYGADQDKHDTLFDKVYEGGAHQFKLDMGFATGPKVVVTQAMCTPDGECTINRAPVERKDLNHYLPIVEPSIVVQIGGKCENSICYGPEGKVVGMSL
jgi:hypothetical protein